jgi:hypothetical protein
MTTDFIYPIHRAVERPLHFKGLAGPYILLAAVALIATLLLFVVLYLCHVPSWLCVAAAFVLGAASLITTRRLSRRFGAHGLERYLDSRSLPRTIRFERRSPISNLNDFYYGQEK